ncbi:MAG: FprA family A-type flavoprotein [Deltaproteobacteria bacterium]|nr:FprA family A-type flavoprotein [Deltaproteobacteria bacterium]
MEPRKISDGVFWVGAADWDRRLFDGLIPLPNGTSYNAYLVEGGTRTALIDGVDPTKTGVLLARLSRVKRIDYIISQHSEQDHSGAIPAVMERHPEAKLLASPKGKELLSVHIGIPAERIGALADNETLDLGGKTLEFMHTPWVHWPETASTYLREDRMLFTCDLFGSHLAAEGLYEKDDHLVCVAARRYYAEVMMPFRANIRRHLERFAKLKIDVIAPSHGPVHTNPDRVVQYHGEWTSEKLSNDAVIAYSTMHGSTAIMAEYLAEALARNGVEARLFNLAVTDLGEFAMSLVDAATIVFGTPTILAGAHPHVISAAFLANALRPKLRFSSVIGSYGWGGKAVEQINSMLSGLKLDALNPVQVKGAPGPEDFKSLDTLADCIAAKHSGAPL